MNKSNDPEDSEVNTNKCPTLGFATNKIVHWIITRTPPNLANRVGVYMTVMCLSASGGKAVSGEKSCYFAALSWFKANSKISE